MGLEEHHLQKGMLALASHTGWPLSELLDLPVETLLQFLEQLPKAKK